jgi:hypothetical protein
MTRRTFVMALLPALVVSAVLVGTARSGQDVKSGLSVGEFAPPFDVLDVTGPNKGNTLCYR